MSLGLPEVSLASFAQRAIVPMKRRMAALVVSPDEIKQVTEELRTTR
jgi:hypothetical protein